MTAETKPVDVLSILDAHAAGIEMAHKLSRGKNRDDMAEGLREWREMRAAVAELIEAAAEFRKGTECHICECVYCEARSRRIDAALARIGGAA